MYQLVWFKRDLRIHDHAALSEAAARGPVMPLYIIEPELWRQADMSGRQWEFVRESLVSLREQLAGIGQPLLVRSGDAVDVIRDLHHQHRISAAWSHQETGNAWTYARDRRVGEWLRANAIPWQELRQHGVVRGALDRDRWSRQWEALMTRQQHRPPVLAPLPTKITPGPIPRRPTEWPLDDPCPGRQSGGRQFAEQALHSFLHARGERYHVELSSPSSAFSSCSRLSAHLACGSLSMRETLQATRLRRQQIAQQRSLGRHASTGSWSKALSAFEGRLHWHCHFMQKLESEPGIELENLHGATSDLRSDKPDSERLTAWMRGETGWPLVDACMRALDHNGWINFRMRAMLTSVASYQLWLHWREPGLHLARRFVDYEPGIHWPQLQMQSGTTGINTLRIYNPVKQSLEHDPNGTFIRTWVPELSAVDDTWIHTPWKMPHAQQLRCGVRIGKDYPAPLVDHEAAARLARQRIGQARRGGDARAQSRRIQQQHGSRRRPRDTRRAAQRQGDLFNDGS